MLTPRVRRTKSSEIHGLGIRSRLTGALAQLLLAIALWADNLLPNANFEKGGDEPVGWRLAGGKGRRVRDGYQGRSALSVEGNGNDESSWRTDGMSLKPGTLFRLNFFGRRQGDGRGGAALAGLTRANRDFRLSNSWEQYSFVFSAPGEDKDAFVRLGQWHVTGTLFFSDAELVPVVPIHSQFVDELELGEGESIHGGSYRFRPRFDWLGANYHRPLALNRAAFNSNRWLFSRGAEVVYRLGVNGSDQGSARVLTGISYYTGGTLRIDASRDNTNWVAVGSLQRQPHDGSYDLPAQMFPAQEIFIRLSYHGTNGNLQVTSFEYEARLLKPLPDGEGATSFMAVLQADERVALSLNEVKSPQEAVQKSFAVKLTNATDSPLTIAGTAKLDSSPASPIERRVVVPNSSVRWTISSPAGDPGEHGLTVQLHDESGRTVFAGGAVVSGSVLADRRPGYWLPGRAGLGVWWCESGWKIGREREPPPKPSDNNVKPVSLSAARGEYEPVQVVLRPEQDGELVSATLDPLRDERGEKGAISVQFHQVVYIQVRQPSDTTSARGWYPDPLPPLDTPLTVHRGQNQPLWITFYVAPDCHAGNFRGTLLLKTTWGESSVPVSVRVYDFSLPKQAQLKSALGLTSGAINQYHRLRRPEDKEAVYQKYLLSFAEHRLSPIAFDDYAPLDVRFIGESTNKRVRIDFQRFDHAATNWLDRHGFTTFRVPLIGMGSGGSELRRPGQLGGFKQGTPKYDALFRDYLSQVELHLREHKWLDKAYAYWFDEPNPQDFDFVAAGMDQIKTAAPDIRRMVTATPDPKLIGHVDIWCGLTHKWTLAQISQRKAAAEEVWWYIATVPKAPYITEFVDHPGTELRLWPWQSWQYGLSGILIWDTVYWNSALVYPGLRLQDPWEDSMSYLSGYGFQVGHVGMWGNGDGRFLYPPRPDSETNSAPRLDGPIPSVRWENLRDGMEDYDYFWLLQQAVERAARSGVSPSVIAEARGLLTVPAEISQDLTHFTTDPRPMLAHRDRIARMIEKLKDAIGHAP